MTLADIVPRHKKATDSDEDSAAPSDDTFELPRLSILIESHIFETDGTSADRTAGYRRARNKVTDDELVTIAVNVGALSADTDAAEEIKPAQGPSQPDA
ncbi:hypothetical protein Back2_00410 [Nocardioides baekrokdamisoli]|uniref:Uncharacterized protein n=1 Tax=Nocardioides baekrokdamisoli TaxID=1804624 RepID=A0A3G9IX60_9ACTN|nr:hypothetical protein [Nocardioides baekrokdamisoli]BBH15754.1 hypothetical protein Back2_00410 [Nocardioides baekrokdamisoli]